ncbi:hypothetical protein RchiOBHm_Chr4g0431181 [Rosa chinensis]|uniref:Uncharacterized protein n=1 Tax=Rosa chinensis TaxID=74649 RepID=A0A2P6R0Q4_ROSCH|nr:hypothetical protein RchiOBHm_Chr4g0431181 [Rosa chinensis]
MRVLQKESQEKSFIQPLLSIPSNPLSRLTKEKLIPRRHFLLLKSLSSLIDQRNGSPSLLSLILQKTPFLSLLLLSLCYQAGFFPSFSFLYCDSSINLADLAAMVKKEWQRLQSTKGPNIPVTQSLNL